MFTTSSLITFGVVAAYHVFAHTRLGGRLFGLLGRGNPLTPSAPPPSSPTPAAPIPVNPVSVQPSAQPMPAPIFHGILDNVVASGLQGVLADIQKQAAAGVMPASLGEALKAELAVLVQSAVAAGLADTKK